MLCIAVGVNDHPVCVAGIANASLITPSVGGAVSDEYPPLLHVGGMCELDIDRPADVYWCEDFRLQPGDIVRFAFAESQQPSPPVLVKPTDSAEYIEEQRRFEELEKSFVPDHAPMRRTWPNLAFECVLNGEPAVIARLAGDEEHILCTLQWDKWHPERCRVFVRSFGDKSRPEATEATEWFRSYLTLGDVLEIRVAA